jgi:hypothetical protein
VSRQLQLPLEISRRDLVIWAAGFFDGEGCIGVSRSKKGKLCVYYSIQITAFQNVRAPLDIFAQLFGGTIRYSTTHSTGGWVWQLSGRALKLALEEMLPFLVVKREQAQIGIAFQGRKAPRGGKYEDGLGARLLDHQDWEKMHALKLINGGQS